MVMADHCNRNFTHELYLREVYMIEELQHEEESSRRISQVIDIAEKRNAFFNALTSVKYNFDYEVLNVIVCQDDVIYHQASPRWNASRSETTPCFHSSLK